MMGSEIESMGIARGELPAASDDEVEEVTSWPRVEASSLGFEIQPVGGGMSLTELQPHTSYELHYSAEAELATWYLLIAVAESADEGLDLIEAPVTGPWADASALVVTDVLDADGMLIAAPGRDDFFYTDTAMNTQYLTPDAEESAPPAGMLCIITTGGPGTLELRLYMLGQSGEERPQTLSMEAVNLFVVIDERE